MALGEPEGPDQRVDLGLAQQLLGELDALRRVAGVIEDDIFDIQVAGLLRQQGNGVLLRNADEGRRSAGRGDDADLDLGQHRHGCGQRQPGQGC
jgi:hypothetical protein